MKRLKWIAASVAIAYLAICACMWGFQRQLMYLPMGDVKAPAAYQLHRFQDIRIQSADGTRLQAWFREARAGYPTILYFHGNGGNLGHRAHYFQLLTDAGFGVLALSYRGYGESEGSPTEAGLYADARALIRYAQDTLGLPQDRMVFYGESLGTGVAVQMATEHPGAAVVLQSPYTSITAVAQELYPWLPVRFLLKDRYDSLSKITKVHAPLLVMHGEKDTLVPATFGKALYKKANAPKQAVYLPDIGHLDFDLTVLTQTLQRFCATQQIIR